VAGACVLLFLMIGCASANTTSPSPTADGGDWPMYRGDLARDGHPAEATLNAQAARRLKPAWQVEMSGAINGTPAVAGGMVVAASAGGVVAAYRLGTGATLWQLNKLGAMSGSPTIAAAHVIVGTLTGHIVAIGLDGTLLWDSVAPGIKPAIWSSPTVYGQLVLAGVGSQYGDSPLETGRIIALDLATGTRVWSLCVLECQPGDGIWSTPTYP
jgi:outer membrane protein assembly factor BamB